MIKDILANLSVTNEGGPAGDYAVSVAAALQAHLTGIAFIYDPVVPVSGTGYIPAEVIETEEADNETAAKAAGAPIRVAAFVRFALGEGIDRPTTDFAAEVGAQLQH